MKYLLLIIALGCLSISAFGQANLTMKPLNQVDGPILFDGIVNEKVWLEMDPLPLTMHWPSYRGEKTENTLIYITYNEDYIYLAAICFDQTPDDIQRPTFKRDEWNETMDHIAMVLDTYNDDENAVIFVVSASGSRVDATVKNDAQSGGAISESWNSYWAAKVSSFDQGWQMEMRIPFSSLRFQVNENTTNMGVGVYRYIPRKSELHVFPDIAPDWGYWSFVKPSKLASANFGKIESDRPWYVSPYTLGGLGYHHEYDDLSNFNKVNDNDFQVGLDVQHALTENLNADLTINTDFAQAEADNQAVNLSRFSLFFPEKRRFFLERASTFDFRADGNNNLFYSRRIGIKQGERIPLLGGVRLVGRVNAWDVGLINMQSRETSDFSAENYGVLRLRRNVFNSRSYIGGMFTSRVSSADNQNYAFGLDGSINVVGDDYLQFNLAQSNDSQDPAGADYEDRSRFYFEWENRKARGFGYSISYSNVGNNYNPDLGFERRFNFSEFQTGLSYLWFVEEYRKLRTISFGINGETSFQNTTGNLETRSIGGSFALNWDRSNSLNLSSNFQTDRVPSSFRLSDDILITSAEYQNTNYSVSYSTPSGSLIKSTFGGQFGKFYGGDRITASVTPSIVLSKYVQLGGLYQYSNIDFPDLNETFISHLGRLNLNVSLNIRWSISTIAQINTISDISTLNFRLRYNPTDGNDLYIVFNEIRNNDPNSVTPALPISDSRIMLVKYVHTFQF